MRRILLGAALILCRCFATDTGFNGRWDIEVLGEPRGRAWWLEVEGAGTPQIRGKFIGFPGGDLNQIQKIWIENGELRFTFDRQSIHQEYRARLVARDKLAGTFESGSQRLKWAGMRAPEISDQDDGSWRESEPVRLFNHKDLSGWKAMAPGKQLGWTVENGLLKSSGGADNLVSTKTFWNFNLHVEYRIAERSNSGIGLRGRYEVQILDDYGRKPDTHSNGALYSRIAPSVNASKKAGEWQTYDIRLVGRNVRVVLNGTKVVEGVIEGLTAMASDPHEGKPGPITLQGDHGPVEFRNIVLTPLVRK